MKVEEQLETVFYTVWTDSISTFYSVFSSGSEVDSLVNFYVKYP